MNNVPYLDLTKYIGYIHGMSKILCRLDTATKSNILSDIIKIYARYNKMATLNLATTMVAIYCANTYFS